MKTIRNSFLKVKRLCWLDLSYNGLTELNHNWANWSSIDRGIDFQGNPLSCGCQSQWIVDILVPLIYERVEQQHFMRELR